MRRVSVFFDSMTGRIFLVMVLGIAFAGASTVFLADMKRHADMEDLARARAADQLVGFVNLLNRRPPSERLALAEAGTQGTALAMEGAAVFGDDPALLRRMNSALFAAKVVSVRRGAPITCILSDRRPRADRLATNGVQTVSEDDQPAALLTFPIGSSVCWIAEVQFSDGESLRLAVIAPPDVPEVQRAIEPLVLAALGLIAAGLAFLLAWMTGAPNQRLAHAARRLGANLDQAPLPEVGPREVREAVEAFNTMQKRLRRNLAERTQMLAAITHDLQTPMTRLRLRLEKVRDEGLRERLIADLAAMQNLIREGLELARSSQTLEPFVVLDLDSMLESLVEDEADAGRKAVLAGRSGRDVRVRPQALRRCLSNLIDNALTYGETAEVSAESAGQKVLVRIRDRGPGIPPDQLEAVFDPLVRLENSRSRETGGTGLGLTIARKLAEETGGDLVLANHPEGGCVATLTLPAA